MGSADAITHKGPFSGSDQREFFVWVNPKDTLVQHNLGFVGTLTGGPLNPGEDTLDHLPFIPNPKQKVGIITPFHAGIVRAYAVEYDLERYRIAEFSKYPSRIWALYLFANRDTANAYAECHPAHVAGRVLKRGLTVGPHRFSLHDAAWIDFLRLAHSTDADTIAHCARGYWSGALASNASFQAQRKPWRPTSVLEVLFYGRLDFPNKDLSSSD